MGVVVRRRHVVAPPPVVPAATGAQPPEGGAQERLAYVDGLRALAALAVVLVHAFEIYGLGSAFPEESRPWGGLGDGPLASAIRGVYSVVHLALCAVPIFIVLSGYSLLLPRVRAPEGTRAVGPLAFYRRRVRRIVPPYYAALALSLLLIALVPGLNRPANVYWDLALPALEPHAILSHLLFLHNAPGYWYAFTTINPPLWTIAVEEQIYLLFPLLALVWRAWGAVAVLAVGLAYGTLTLYLPFTVLPLSYTWYVGLFAMGLFAASLSFPRTAREARWRARLPWGTLALLALPVLAAVIVIGNWVALGGTSRWLRVLFSNTWSKDYVVGVAMACLLIACSTRYRVAEVGRSPLMRVLQAPALVAIGRFSYSLYLLHAPILASLALLFRGLGFPAVPAHLAVIAAGVPLCVLVAAAFALVFERRQIIGLFPWWWRRTAQAVALAPHPATSVDQSPR